ncbi:SusC/RagA family TonB-linked outer membrane protein [Ginsengibacter hankyongi]|uniref:SusC/RagA family TonB-linked outer membrane protein n=1 Tax=Ginsengibacter hankyongi TaxID=2607284 RepID=A0A5J5IFA1_9BACT|nr:SusC/RagA family TonB-linked outer membrane protein [Ginsengibacter hankyongi]KAA9037760.1 SusC/RagA family TonB-linked outer membrane protein [Ginsengibacter hankyongi]
MTKLNFLQFTIVIVSFLLFSFVANGQRKLSGIVEDEATNLPLDGATVSIKNHKNANAVTDKRGKFDITVPNEKITLVISFVNYHEKLVTVGGKETSVLILLNKSSTSLDDVVILGVQSQTKRTTTSAVSTVLSKQIENLPAVSVDQLLQGRVAGLNVQMVSGEPGVAPTIVVRGNSKMSTNINDQNVAQAHALSGPLYVIDGVPTNPDDIANSIDATGTNYLAGININDIASVDVQKDAAATAAWGSRGANGVIYITTKKGLSSTPEFRVNVYHGITQEPKLLVTQTGAAERAQKMNLLDQYRGYMQPGVAGFVQVQDLPQVLTDRFNPYFNNATDWQGLFYQQGKIDNVDATISAANKGVNYRVSMNYYNEQGIIKAFGITRYSMRGNFNFTISPKLKSQLIVAFSRNDRKRGRKYNNSDDNIPIGAASQPSSFFRLNSFDSLNFNGLYNKLRNKNINDYISASLTTDYSILPSLKYTFQGAVNTSSSNRDYFQPSNIDGLQLQLGNVQPSYAESDKGTYSTYFLSNTLNFNKKIIAGNHTHNFVLTGSQQFTSDVSNTNSVWGSNIPSNNIQVVSGVPQSDLGGYSNYSADGLLSFVGQFQYDLDSKYLLYASYRTDASSRFGDKSKWGTFPAVGLGWNIAEENFMKKITNIVPYLKLRASYGLSGSQSSDLYAPYNSYQIPGNYNGVVAIQPSYTNGLTKNNLTWATTSQKNIGIDAQLFNSRISLSVDFYEKLSKDDYYNFTLPFYTGFGRINFNAKDLWIVNKGQDITLSTKNLSRKSPLQWNMQITVSHNINVIAKLPNNNRTFIDESGPLARIYSVGQPIYEFYQMHYLGVINNPSEIPFDKYTGQVKTYHTGWSPVLVGWPLYQSVLNNDDIWKGDRLPSGDPNPRFTGGWANDFTYKNFSLSILSVFTWKRAIYNSFKMDQVYDLSAGGLIYSQRFANNRMIDVSKWNYWLPSKAKADPNYKADYPMLNPYLGTVGQFTPISDIGTEDGSYFKVKSIVLGYQLPNTLMNKMKLKGARIYAVMDNVLTLTKSGLPDPEAVDQVGNYTGGLYPLSKKFTFGIDVQF